MAFKFIKLIMLVMNWSPFLHVSNDSNFDSIDNLGRVRTLNAGSVLMTGDRISLLAIECGSYKFYFISFVKDNGNIKFEIYKCLKFYDVCEKFYLNHVDRKADAYESLIESHDENKLNVQIDFLKEKLNQNQNRISGIYDKITNYAAIILVYIGFFSYLLTEIITIKNNNNYFDAILWVILFISIAYTLNFVCFIQFGLSVKTYVRSKFSDLKSTPTNKQLAVCYYIDWYSSKNDADIMSSILCYIQMYYIRSLCASFLLWLLMFLSSNNLLDKAPSFIIAYENEKLIENKTNDFLIDHFLIFSEKNEINSIDFNKCNSCESTKNKKNNVEGN